MSNKMHLLVEVTVLVLCSTPYTQTYTHTHSLTPSLPHLHNNNRNPTINSIRSHTQTNAHTHVHKETHSLTHSHNINRNTNSNGNDSTTNFTRSHKHAQIHVQTHNETVKPLPRAVDVMRALFTDLNTSVRFERNTTSVDGAPLHQLHVVEIPTASETRPGMNPQYLAAATDPRGIMILGTTDLVNFSSTGLIKLPGASAPFIAMVTGTSSAPHQSWWVVAYETTTQIGAMLFTSTATLQAGRPQKNFLCPNSELLPAHSQKVIRPVRYSSPTVYAAVHSQQSIYDTVDIVLSTTWTDGSGYTHPANALIDALSPSEMVNPTFHVIFAFDGKGYGNNPFAGPLKWEAKMQSVISNFSYTGSSAAFIPCGAGCGDPRDRAGGNVDGIPGTVKVSVIGGQTDVPNKGRLLLWAWDPIVKAAWLWPSGFGTGQGGFANSALELFVPGANLTTRPDPKMTVLKCPIGVNTSILSQCLWVAVSIEGDRVDEPPTRCTFVQPLVTPVLNKELFSRRYQTRFPQKREVPTRRPKVSSRRTVSQNAVSDGLTFQNAAFRVIVADDGSNFTIYPLTAKWNESRLNTFAVTFLIVHSILDPLLGDLKDKDGGLYSIADMQPSYWRRKNTVNPTVAGDSAIRITASSCSKLNSSSVAFAFNGLASHGPYTLSATLNLPPDNSFPHLTWRFIANTTGYFSIAFGGAPGAFPNSTLGFSQAATCLSQAQNPHSVRCPVDSGIVVPDAAANLPYSLISVVENFSGVIPTSVALVVDPSSTIPFEPCEPWPSHPKSFSGTCPLPTCSNNAPADACQNRGWASEARSSLGIRDGTIARPMIWAPVLGGFGSQMSQGSSHIFRLQLLVDYAPPSEVYRRIARDVYGFNDERDNSGPGSLNGALERMGAYLSDMSGNNFQQWDAINKYSFYWVDQPSAFKPLDIMSGLSIAMVTDDDRMYTNFAKEIAKYSLSHSDSERYLWPYLPTVGLNKPGSPACNHLGMAQNHGNGFCSPSEALQIYRLTGSQSPSILDFAKQTGFNASLPCPNGDGAYRAMSFWESSTGLSRQKWWNCTVTIAASKIFTNVTYPKPASEYICTDTDFFVTLYQLTGDPKYKQAAQLSEANCEADYQIFPRATAADGHMVAVDKENASLSYWWTHGRFGSWGFPGGELPQWAEQKTVPLWRASHNGIKVSGSSGGGGWLGTICLDSPVRMMRVATIANDSFARALARASLVGRFGHFPGDFQSKPRHTLVWEAPDLADHIYAKQKQTTWNTGHFWAMAGVVVDFLLTDAADRTGNRVIFPSTVVENTPHGRMYSPALGPGVVYGKAAYPWVPSGLFVSVDNVQVNWIAAYSDYDVYFILLSQSFSDEIVRCLTNTELVSGLTSPDGINATLWVNNNMSFNPVMVMKGAFEINIPAKGVVVLQLPNVSAKTRLHQKVLAKELHPLSVNHSRAVLATNGPFGIVTGMALRWGRNMTELYAFSQANSTIWHDYVYQDPLATSKTVFESVTLNWSVDGGAIQRVVATIFPFDFSVSVPDDCGEVRFYFSGFTSSGTFEQTPSQNVAFTTSVSAKIVRG